MANDLVNTANALVVTMLPQTSANSNAVGSLSFTASSTYDQFQLEAVIQKIDELINALRAAEVTERKAERRRRGRKTGEGTLNAGPEPESPVTVQGAGGVLILLQHSLDKRQEGNDTLSHPRGWCRMAGFLPSTPLLL